MSDVAEGDYVRSACPTCGSEARRKAYDIGSGPELSCSRCEWCWGANGQPLRPVERPGVCRECGRMVPLDHGLIDKHPMAGATAVEQEAGFTSRVCPGTAKLPASH